MSTQETPAAALPHVPTQAELMAAKDAARRAVYSSWTVMFDWSDLAHAALYDERNERVFFEQTELLAASSKQLLDQCAQALRPVEDWIPISSAQIEKPAEILELGAANYHQAAWALLKEVRLLTIAHKDEAMGTTLKDRLCRIFDREGIATYFATELTGEDPMEEMRAIRQLVFTISAGIDTEFGLAMQRLETTSGRQADATAQPNTPTGINSELGPGEWLMPPCSLNKLADRCRVTTGKAKILLEPFDLRKWPAKSPQSWTVNLSPPMPATLRKKLDAKEKSAPK